MTSTFAANSLITIIETRLALTLDEHRRANVMTAVDELVAAGDITRLYDLIDLLTTQPTSQPLWQKFIRIATVGETYFFRDQGQINALRDTVLPRLIEDRRKRGRYQLRLWSAGCSTGEEPYTLAILLRELIPDLRSWDIRILATDLNNSSLESARRGSYGSWSFRSETPYDLRNRWFVQTDGRFQLDRSVRDMVTFAQLNLSSNAYPSYRTDTLDMDLILCRNVLIYFGTITSAEVLSRFYKALRSDGWLVLGHSESIHVIGKNFRPVNFEGAVLYQKQLALEAEPPVSTPVVETPPFALFEIERPVQRAAYSSQEALPAAPPAALQVNNAASLLKQAKEAADKEEFTQALHWLVETEKIDRMRPELHYLRGVIQLQQGETEVAMSSLRQAIFCDSNFVLAYVALGELFEKRGLHTRASHQWNLAHAILDKLPTTDIVAFSGDLTVEILQGLVQYRLNHPALGS